MNQESRQCQSCKNQFTIEPDDFVFYEKIKVPAPTFCPECRFMRRLAVRNERNLYKRECGLCKKSIISMYSVDKPFPVFCSECWWKDSWDAMAHGRDYDFSKTFFEQFRDLQNAVPRPNVRASNATNSDYCNYFADGKNCYLCFGSIEVEDCLYGSPYNSKFCVDTYLARECDYCYEAIDCEKLSNCVFVQDSSNSFNLMYCFDCKNCQDCIGCAGLRNKQYYVFNQPLSKEEFYKIKNEILSGGKDKLQEVSLQFEKIKLTVPHRFANVLKSDDVSGDHIVQSKCAKECFDVKLAEDSVYCNRMINAKDAYDVNYCEYLERCYEYLGFWKMKNSYFCNTCGESSDLQYCDFCTGSQDLFGCVGLRNKQYCILNKQYTKEEYGVLVEKIKKQMTDMPYRASSGIIYKYGEYFPVELSLLNYNETVAQDFFPLTKAEAVQKNYGWQPPVERNYKISAEVLACEHEGKCNHQCTTAFKITSAEIQFYQKMNLPSPTLCPNCRHYERLAKRNPFKLWRRKCMKPGCPNEFETSYAPERQEIVYCESCYNAEVV